MIDEEKEIIKKNIMLIALLIVIIELLCLLYLYYVKYPKIEFYIIITFILIMTILMIIRLLTLFTKITINDDIIIFDTVLIRKTVPIDILKNTCIGVRGRYISFYIGNNEYLILVNKKTKEGLIKIILEMEKMPEDKKDVLVNKIEWISDNF